MNSDPNSESLVGFFKVLAEPKRLKIVGLLAQQARTVEQLAGLLKLSVSTTSHHLSRLNDAGLVSASAQGYYRVYTLRTDVLRTMASALLKETEQPRPDEEGNLGAFDRKVLATFTTPDGRITAFPSQEKKFLVLVRHVLNAFEHGVRYPEKRVNQVLARYNADTARLRRALVDHHFMAREGGGGKYWRIDERGNP